MSCFWKNLVETTCNPTPSVPVVAFSLFGSGDRAFYEDSGSGNNSSFTAIAAHTDIISIATGLATSLLLDINGVAKGIGDAFSDELKTGNFGSETSYVDVATGISKIQGARESLFFINNLGELEVTGFYAGTDNSNNWVDISGGDYYYLVINDANDVYGRGRDGAGQQGRGSTTTGFRTFSQATTGFVKVSCGGGGAGGTVNGGHSLALTASGDLYSTGDNNLGQLGLGDNTNRDSFTFVGSGYSDINAGSRHSVALKSNGEVYTCGGGSFGELGLGDFADNNSFTLAGSGFSTLARGISDSSCTFAIKANGDMHGTGRNLNSELGLGDTTNRNTLTLIGAGFKSVSAGQGFSIALK